MGDTDLGKLWNQLGNAVGGSVTDIIGRLRESSIGEQVRSWIGEGENEPVTAAGVADALGSEQIAKIAAKTGTTPEQAAQDVADRLPDLVDRLTPDGRVPDPQAIKEQVGTLGGGEAGEAAVGGSSDEGGGIGDGNTREAVAGNASRMGGGSDSSGSGSDGDARDAASGASNMAGGIGGGEPPRS